MNLLAIDPGPRTCGVVLLDVEVWPPRVIMSWDELPVETLLTGALRDGVVDAGYALDAVAAERVTGYMERVGASTFETCEVFGDIRNECRHSGVDFSGLNRKEVKSELGLPPTADDAVVNRAVRELYPATGGENKRSGRQVGTKKAPGPLYGLSEHSKAALALGVAWCLRRTRRQRAAELEALKAGQQPELFE